MRNRLNKLAHQVAPRATRSGRPDVLCIRKDVCRYALIKTANPIYGETTIKLCDLANKMNRI